MLDQLISKLRSRELSLDEFAKAAAAQYVFRKPLPYPETDGNEGLIDGVSAVSIDEAIAAGDLTEAEAEAVYAALAPIGP